MPDPGSPDQDPKPFKPDPNRPFFGDRMPARPLADPDPNYDPDKPDSVAPTSQETRFQAAAIKCAQMEEELEKLFTEFPQQETPFSPQEGVWIYTQNPREISTWIENIQGVEGGKEVEIIFRFDETADAEALKINTTRDLEIELHTDEKTRQQFEEYAKKDPEIASYTSTHYYFTLDGEYKKSCFIPRAIPASHDRNPLYPGTEVGIYESEMAPGDFEIAAIALQTLISRLKLQESA